MSRVDRIFRRVIAAKIFSKGWGNPENLKRLFEFRQVLTNREQCQTLVDHNYPITIDKEYESGGIRTLEGHFLSPFAVHMKSVVPKEVETARFQVVLPASKCQDAIPMCVQLAGTGDHHYWRRRNFMAKPLLKDYGIGSVILENPYYGKRKPFVQKRSCLQNVADLFVMGGSLILESLALFHWIERQGWGPLGITGLSLGGHMASVAATNWHKPISLVPCLSWSTASYAFTRGVISGSIPWDVLQSQYKEDDVYERELRKLLHSPECGSSSAYQVGQEFARSYHYSDEILKTRGDGDSDKTCREEEKRTNDVPISVKNKWDCIGKSTSVDLPRTLNLSRIQAIDSNSRNWSELVNGQSTLATSDDSRCQVCDSSSSSPTSLNNTKTKRNGLATAGRFLNKLWRVERGRHSDGSHPTSLKQESVEFMQGIMDDFTHLTNFSRPVDPRLAIIVVAKRDAYIPRDGPFALDTLWPGSEVRYIDSGHVSSFLFQQAAFRKAIGDSFARQKQLYPS